MPPHHTRKHRHHIAPDTERIHMAKHFDDIGDHAGAVGDHTAALVIDREYKEALYNLGNAKGRLGDHDGTGGRGLGGAHHGRLSDGEAGVSDSWQLTAYW